MQFATSTCLDHSLPYLKIEGEMDSILLTQVWNKCWIIPGGSAFTAPIGKKKIQNVSVSRY